MTIHPKSLTVLALCALLAPAGGHADVARAAPAANKVQAIGVSDAAGGAVELEIRGERAPSYTVFKLQDPPRLVVDLAGADVSGVSGPVAVGRAGVREVSTAQYSDEKTSVGRVIVALESSAARYEVAPRGQAVVVKVTAGEGSTVTASTPSPTPTSSPTPTPTPSPSVAGTDNVLARRTDEAEVSRPATTITGARSSGGGALVALDGEVARFEVIELSNPPRVAIDLYGVTKAPRAAAPLSGAFKQARFGKDAGKVRVVLDAAAAELPKLDVRRVNGGIAVVPADRAPVRERIAAAAGLQPVAVKVQGDTSEPADISDLRFSQAGGTARIELSGKAAHAVQRPDPRTLVLTLKSARLAKRLERSLDASAFKGPVAMLSSFNQPSGDAKLVLSLRGDAKDALVETPSGLAWTVTSGALPPEPAHTASAEPAAAGFTAEAPSYALTGVPQKREYTGRRITLDFHDIDIRNLLRLIADVSKKNIVVADDVTGKVTVSLRNVPWDQALDLVLKTKGLDKEEMGNVIRVAKFEDIAKEQQARADAAKARAPLIPLKVRIIPVNFARSNDVAGRVKEVLTERGTVTTDERTNVLIVKDTQEALARAEGLVRNLDTEIPQVRIESRIIEAGSNWNQAIGVQWGGNAAFTQATGNPTGLFFPGNAGATGASGGGPTQGVSANPNYAVNLPAAIGQGSGGGIGFTFGSVGGAFNLNLRLSALENSGLVKTISAPSVSTVDNKEATIGQGISIPFSQVSASGVNTVFVEAKLELKVTPHVSADGSVLMKIKVTNNSPNPQLTGANGQPSISKREAETEALVKDGETTVIGGIYTRQTASNNSEVPFFGKLPILGFFFRTKAESDAHTELLIFITPRILNRQVAAAAANGG
ncbi:MAG TPA: type IV pilus secretin PilQ [Anaeromyxobacteraceae bacterium]|nr:type IV pilus secretin PilQ [Anaeromyxobacteraceae bacterium]